MGSRRASGGAGTILPSTNGGRLTLTTGTPVTTADVESTTIYWEPYSGNHVALYDGASWAYSEIGSGVSLLASADDLDGNALEPTVYDVFLYLSAGVLTLGMQKWTSSTARAEAISLQNGAWVMTSDTTKRLVGTVALKDATIPGLGVAGTMTVSGGNAALIDDAPGTAAADVSGYNTSTAFRVDFGAGVTKDLSGLSITKETGTGIDNDAIMVLQYSDDDSAWTTAGSAFTISAGTSGVAEYFGIAHSGGAHRYWRIFYSSGTTGGNFWLQEVEFFAGFVDTSANRLVCNANKPVQYAEFASDDTDSWSSSGQNGTWAAVNGGNAAWRHDFVVCLDEEPVKADLTMFGSDGSAGTGCWAFALDSVTALSAGSSIGALQAAGSPFTSPASYAGRPGIGAHYLQAIETTDAAATGTGFGDGGVAYLRSGVRFHGRR